MRERIWRPGRALVVSGALLTLALSGCQTESAGPEVGTDIEDLTNELGTIERDVDELEQRIEALEQEVGPEDETDLFTDQEALVGQQVTVSGEVTEILTPNAFRLAGDDRGILVVSAEDVGDLAPGAVVQVTGTVRLFDLLEFEEDLGIGLDDDVLGGFARQPAIVADRVDVSVPQEGTTDEG